MKSLILEKREIQMRNHCYKNSSDAQLILKVNKASFFIH
jgi:hypothetical protein